MLKKIKKVICVTLSLVMLFTLNSSAFAAEKSATTIKYEEIINNDVEMEFYDYSYKLAQCLAAVNGEEYDSVVSRFTNEYENPVVDEITSFVEGQNKKRNTGDLTTYKLDKNISESLTHVYEIDDATTVTITLQLIIIDELESGSEKLSTYATQKTATGNMSRSYYSSIVGNKIFELGLSCNFYYNGSKASYKSGLDAYYKRGTLSAWQVNNWSKWHEQDGTSYWAYCSGNFHWGLEIDGVGLVIDEYYIKLGLECDKDGTVHTLEVVR